MRRSWLIGLALAVLVASAAYGEEFTKEQAVTALRKAAEFFHQQVASGGGYLWRYSADLSKREGEGQADDRTIWVQPPGTPAVGRAYLHAYRVTGDRYYLEAAHDAAKALVRGQLRSGGWDYKIHLDERQNDYALRHGSGGKHNTTTLDDNTTQAALRFLIEMDVALEGADVEVRDTVDYALQALLDAQYPNGAWPQRFSQPPNAEEFPVKPASYPNEWSWIYPKTDYSRYYTFNDNTLADTLNVMLLAARRYNDERYRAAALKAGEFILLAQMPDPQPAWAQQYDRDMHPAWARRFEPPAITGAESQGVIEILIGLYRETGDERYLDAGERAVRYLQKSVLPDGRLARFYELRTNTPLYFTLDYVLTYSDASMPTHYGFKTSSILDSLARKLEAARRGESPTDEHAEPAASAREVAEALDPRGAWVEKGRLRYHGDDDTTTEVIDCHTFIENVGILARFIAETP